MKKPEFEPGKSEIRTGLLTVTLDISKFIFCRLAYSKYLFIYLVVPGPSCGI